MGGYIAGGSTFFERYDPNDTSSSGFGIDYENTPDPYAGMNRKQRRAAMAKERKKK